MPTQDEIIHNTEIVFEDNRRLLSNLQKSDLNTNCVTNIRNILFEAIVLFYTHRTIWTQEEFWQHYASSENPVDFANKSYQQMVKCTLIQIYNNLYFCIEGALAEYLSEHKNSGNIITLFTQISPNQIENYEEIKYGLNILRCVRNSFHGNNGNYVFPHPDTAINFKGKLYKFNKGETVSVSYEFLRDFIPFLPELYKKLFCSSPM